FKIAGETDIMFTASLRKEHINDKHHKNKNSRKESDCLKVAGAGLEPTSASGGYAPDEISVASNR
ncbi:MAG: hypothetical protein ACKOA1_00275, partial [Bacteroidota bacterium]